MVAAIEKVLDVEKVEGTAVSIDEIPDERRGYGDFVLQEQKRSG